MQTQKMPRRLCAFVIALLMSGCASSNPKPTTTLRLYEQADSRLPTGSFSREVTIKATQQKMTISPAPSLTEKDVLEARLQSTAGGDAILLRFDLHGANVLNEMTTNGRGRYLVVLLNDRPVAAVLLDHIISDGQFLLEGDFTDEEAKKIVADLNEFAGRRRDHGDTRLAP